MRARGFWFGLWEVCTTELSWPTVGPNLAALKAFSSYNYIIAGINSTYYVGILSKYNDVSVYSACMYEEGGYELFTWPTVHVNDFSSMLSALVKAASTDGWL